MGRKARILRRGDGRGRIPFAAAFGGLAFGAIQASPWFNLVVALVFLALGLATSEVFFIDFSRFRPRPKAGGADAKRGLFGPFLLGAGSLRFGYLGHPWRKEIWVFGEKLLPEIARIAPALGWKRLR